MNRFVRKQNLTSNTTIPDSGNSNNSFQNWLLILKKVNIWWQTLNQNVGASIMSNEGYHEPVSELSDETRDMHRAIISLMEEL